MDLTILFKEYRRFRTTRHRKSQYKPAGLFWTAGLFFIAVILLYGWWLYFTATDDVVKTGIFQAVMTATVAAIGVYITVVQTSRIATRRFTLDILNERFSNESYLASSKAIIWARREGKLGTLDDIKKISLDQLGRSTLYDAVVEYLNYWELLATAYVHGRVDRYVFEESVDDMYSNIITGLGSIIGEMRMKDDSAMEHLCAVFFCLGTRSEHRKFIPDLGIMPPQALAPVDQDLWQRAAKVR